ncbi:MAG: gamma-glutamylcyclotransferase [Deltaproteobacteria bacterium]|nr:gamma-glutamylcyclotransferase [Deltaproteobacteria bacterium]
MPEGDTIFRLARKLRTALAGKTVREARTSVPGLDATTLEGRTVVDVESRGKSLLLRLDDGRAVHAHMRMTGSWRLFAVGTAETRALAPSAHPRGVKLLLVLDDVVAACVAAPVVELLTPWQQRHHRATVELGPDLLGATFDPDEARARLRARAELEIGEALAIQSVVAGIGNVYKSELLFIERVDPFARVGELDDATLAALLSRARTLLRRNVGRGPRRTRSGEGPLLWVYERSGAHCLVCGTPIRMRRQGAAARSTYFCPACQRVDRTPDRSGTLTRVFVYGTLLQGERNHRVLAGSPLLGHARTRPAYVLVDLGRYPAMAEGGTDTVVGEVYEVDAEVLGALDALEGHPGFYRRVPIALDEDRAGYGGVVGYVLPPDEAGRHPRIASGDWRAHRSA